jgi:hypothetical protein
MSDSVIPPAGGRCSPSPRRWKAEGVREALVGPDVGLDDEREGLAPSASWLRRSRAWPPLLGELRRGTCPGGRACDLARLALVGEHDDVSPAAPSCSPWISTGIDGPAPLTGLNFVVDARTRQTAPRGPPALLERSDCTRSVATGRGPCGRDSTTTPLAGAFTGALRAWLDRLEQLVDSCPVLAETSTGHRAAELLGHASREELCSRCGLPPACRSC